MKNLRKLLLVLLAMLMTLALSAAVFAEGDPDAAASSEDDGVMLTTSEGDPKEGETSDNDGQIPTTGAADDVAESGVVAEPKSVGVVSVTDGKGKDMYKTSGLGCLGSGISFYIKNDYEIVLGYVEGSKAVPTDDELILSIEDDDGNVTYEHNTIRIHASDKTYTFKINYADGTIAGGVGTYSIPVSRFKLDMADLLVAAIGIYVIISAIRGGGGLFNDEYIKEEKKEDFKKYSRILCIAAGVLCIVSAALGICFSYLGWVAIARYVCFGLAMLCLIGLMVLNNVYTDKEKKQKAQQTAGTGGGRPSVDAFEFDGTEPTLDEVLADLDKKKAEAPADEPKDE